MVSQTSNTSVSSICSIFRQSTGYLSTLFFRTTHGRITHAPDLLLESAIKLSKTVFLLPLLCPLQLFAQIGPFITGTVQDSSGAVIRGAVVRLLSQKGRPIAQQVTDGGGGFRFSSATTGSYVLDVTESGFREARVLTSVSAGESAPTLIVMAVKGEDDSISVDGSALPAQVDTAIEANQNANSVDRSALDRLPVFDNDYVTTLSRFLDPDSIGTNGVTLVVNGVEANGPGVTPSAVASVKINHDPYSVLFSRPGRARLELETEGGTPQFHGSATFLYRDSLFDAQPAFAAVKPAEQRTYYEGSLTGPLSRDKKTTFLVSFERDNDNLQSIVDAALPTGEIHENVPSPIHHYILSERVFHDYGQANHFWIGYSYEHGTDANVGVGGTVLPEAGTDTVGFEHEINVQDTYVASPKLVNLVHFLVGHNDSRIRSTTDAAQIAVSGSFTGGGAQADTFRTESHFDGVDIVTYSSGKQVIKFGIDVPDISRRGNDDFTNQLGTYSFDSLQSYQASQPFQYIVQTGSGHVAFVEKVVSGLFADDVRVSPKLSISAGVRYYFQNYFHDVPHNVAPRLSLAYAPFRKGSTVVRGGAGFFFDRTGPSPIADLVHYNGANLLRLILIDPTYPATPIEVSAVPTSLVTLDPRARIPYTLQYGLGVEQQVTAKSTAAINYIGARGIDLFRSINTNAPQTPGFSANPNRSLGQVREIQSKGYLKSNSLEFTFRGSPTPYFTGQVQYVLAKTYNNTGGIRYFPADSYDPNADWSRSDNDRRHKLNLLGTVHARRWFDLGTALSVNSGMPTNVTTGDDNNSDGVINDRPAGIPRNSLHGPDYLDLDLDLSREFAVTKDTKGPTFTLSLNSFNTLNHQNDVTYVGIVSSPFFDKAVAAQPSRRLQLNLQIKF
ncbi:Oar protein [Granulicella sibirica]|uniref:Oar protein n=1 Tax=Granulicella sibirica TaxID=2479048 RepID=A0A4Q0T5D0_9BACT|nr:Oar protein [Granulicella sibirica]